MKDHTNEPLHPEPHSRRGTLFNRNTRQFLFVFVAALGVVTGHWTAETWWHWLNDEWLHHPGAVGGFLVTGLFLCCPLLLYKLRQAWRRPLTRIPVNEVPPPREVLLWFLSELHEGAVPHYADGIPKWFEPTGNLDADIATLTAEKEREKGQLWQWEMTLRGIRHHRGRLRTLLLIVSDKSAPQVHWLGKLLHRYDELKDVHMKVLVRRKGEPWIDDCPTESPLDPSEGWDFEDFNTLAEAVTAALTRLNETGVPGDKRHRRHPHHSSTMRPGSPFWNAATGTARRSSRCRRRVGRSPDGSNMELRPRRSRTSATRSTCTGTTPN